MLRRSSFHGRLSVEARYVVRDKFIRYGLSCRLLLAERGDDMASRMKPAKGITTLAEMKEFAGFSSATQRYIRRSLDVGLDRDDAMARWSRDVVEAASIRAQSRVYSNLVDVRDLLPDDTGLGGAERFLGTLVTLATFDLGQGRIKSFSAFRFLYERLVGAEVRPWLPSAFCAAAALPHLHPELRRQLLQSISEAAATASGWSDREPVFFPRWVEKVEGGTSLAT